MYGYLLQDWKTVVLDTSISQMIQNESDWMSFQPFSDIVFYTETKAVYDGDGGGTVQLLLETSPSKDSSLFMPMATVTLTGNIGVVQVTPILLASGPTIPLATWVRWRLYNSGTPAAAWNATFRIHCAANAVTAL